MSRRYRDLAAWRLGRPLRPWETVHHIDGNHADNLLVLPGPRAHALLHWYERREATGVQHLWPLEEWLGLQGLSGYGQHEQIRSRDTVAPGDGLVPSRDTEY